MLAVAILFGNTMDAYSQKAYRILSTELGKQPLFISAEKISGSYATNADVLNVICLGQDADWDGLLGDGDEAPSWWQISNIINSNPYLPNPEHLVVKKVMDLPVNFDMFPYRFSCGDEFSGIPALHGNLIALPDKENIAFYDMTSQQQVGHTLYNSNSKSSCFFGKTVAVTSRDYTNPGDWIPSDNWLRLFPAHSFQNPYSINVPHTNVQRVVHYKAGGADVLAVLCEGDGFPAESYIHFYVSKIDLSDIPADAPLDKIFDTLSMQVGLGANDVAVLNYRMFNDTIPYLCVVSSFDNTIYVLDGREVLSLDANKVGITPISAPVAEPNSLREVNFTTSEDGLDQTVFISGYDGKVYYASITALLFTGEAFTIEGKGPIETTFGICKNDVLCAFTTIYQQGGYDPNNLLSIVYTSPTGINDVVKSDAVYPNPASSFITIENAAASQVTSIQLVALDGQIYNNIKYVASDSTLLISLPNIPAGHYIIKLQTNIGIITESIIKQ